MRQSLHHRQHRLPATLPFAVWGLLLAVLWACMPAQVQLPEQEAENLPLQMEGAVALSSVRAATASRPMAAPGDAPAHALPADATVPPAATVAASPRPRPAPQAAAAETPAPPLPARAPPAAA